MLIPASSSPRCARAFLLNPVLWFLPRRLNVLSVPRFAVFSQTHYFLSFHCQLACSRNGRLTFFGCGVNQICGWKSGFCGFWPYGAWIKFVCKSEGGSVMITIYLQIGSCAVCKQYTVGHRTGLKCIPWKRIWKKKNYWILKLSRRKCDSLFLLRYIENVDSSASKSALKMKDRRVSGLEVAHST